MTRSSHPVFLLIGGPQGSGKSTFFPVARTGFDSFNIDDRRRELNQGASQNISEDVRNRARAEYGAFIATHLREGNSFAIEVTMAREVTFEQAAQARRLGFLVHLTYVAADAEECVQRVANRVDMGGHGNSLDVLRATYLASMANVARAIREFDVVQIYDNGMFAEKPQLVLEAQRGALTYVSQRPPGWLKAALADTDFDMRKHRAAARTSRAKTKKPRGR